MRYRMSAILLMAIVVFAGPARAAAFDPAKVSADAKWVIHTDVDAFWKSKLVATAFEMHAGEKEKIDNQINAMSAIVGMDLRKDIHDVTLYSNDDEKQAVLIVSGKLNKNQLMTLLKANNTFKAEQQGDHEILQWAEDGEGKRVKYGAFHGESAALISDSREALAGALEVLGGKKPAMNPEESRLTIPQGEGLLMFASVQADAVKKKARSPIVAQLDTGWMSLSESNDSLVVKTTVNAKNPETAQRLAKSAEGARSFAAMCVSSDATFAELGLKTLDAMKLNVEGNTFNMEWPVTFDALKQAHRMAQERHHKE